MVQIMIRFLILSFHLLLTNNASSEEYSKTIDNYTSNVSYVITGEPSENLKIISSNNTTVTSGVFILFDKYSEPKFIADEAISYELHIAVRSYFSLNESSQNEKDTKKAKVFLDGIEWNKHKVFLVDHRLTEQMNDGIEGFYQEGYSLSYYYKELIEKIINAHTMKIIIGDYELEINLKNFNLKRFEL